ncbi:MAG: hypothetical protein AMXMBFR83_08530 [Phycisphaerae bacterium]
MARHHARRVLREAGSTLSAGHPAYGVMTFRRRHSDEKIGTIHGTIHDCRLDDFLKTSKEPGPDRFVIAYDKASRRCPTAGAATARSWRWYRSAPAGCPERR